MPNVVCPVCGTENDSSRIFCRKCASDLHATVVMTAQGPAVAPPPTPASTPMKPIIIGGGIALLLVLLVLGAVLALGGGTPAASPSPTPELTIVPPTAGPTLSPTHTPEPTAPPVTPGPTAAPPATPAPTPTDAPPIIRFFNGPASVDCSDPSFSGFIHLSWRVGNADGANLSIDGPGVYKQYDGVLREDDVPFTCDGSSHTYILVTYGGLEPPAEKDLVIGPAAP